MFLRGFLPIAHPVAKSRTIKLLQKSPNPSGARDPAYALSKLRLLGGKSL